MWNHSETEEQDVSKVVTTSPIRFNAESHDTAMNNRSNGELFAAFSHFLSPQS